MVAGDLVNTASRIQSHRRARARCTSATRRAARPSRRSSTRTPARTSCKGKVGLYTLWRALRVVSGARGALKSQGLEAPFVGRDRELRLIKELFHACADERHARTSSRSRASPGSASRGSPGSSSSTSTGSPQIIVLAPRPLPLLRRGRHLLGARRHGADALPDRRGREPRSALAKLRATLVEHIVDDGGAAVRRAARRASARARGAGTATSATTCSRPGGVFFERLADVEPRGDGLRGHAVGGRLAARLHRLPARVVARPSRSSSSRSRGRSCTSAGRRGAPAGATSRRSTWSRSRPPAMEQLLHGLVPGLPEEMRAQILERAEGIPLYAVETVRMLLDRGAARRRRAPSTGRRARSTRSRCPRRCTRSSPRGSTGSRPRSGGCSRTRAVLGKTFTRARARRALGTSTRPSSSRCSRSLVRKEVLGVQADPRSPEHGQYGFLQDLVRHVAYETLSKRERKARHLAAAAHLESAFSDEDEVVEVVASHYLDAYRVAPDAEDADEIKRKARAMLARAGERAASLAAAREAQRYFEQAAELADDAGRSARAFAGPGRPDGLATRDAAEAQGAVRAGARRVRRSAALSHAAARVSRAPRRRSTSARGTRRGGRAARAGAGDARRRRAGRGPGRRGGTARTLPRAQRPARRGGAAPRARARARRGARPARGVRCRR